MGKERGGSIAPSACPSKRPCQRSQNWRSMLKARGRREGGTHAPRPSLSPRPPLSIQETLPTLPGWQIAAQGNGREGRGDIFPLATPLSCAVPRRAHPQPQGSPPQRIGTVYTYIFIHASSQASFLSLYKLNPPSAAAIRIAGGTGAHTLIHTYLYQTAMYTVCVPNKASYYIT
mmetsp:Transcript_37627/g.106304  ORF Transcript_37627/g.106304 Transcript_37627/m.106304 type:complete len:174 (+) Transcript_37627:366-887(+)